MIRYVYPLSIKKSLIHPDITIREKDITRGIRNVSIKSDRF